jgi:hypothetical protein
MTKIRATMFCNRSAVKLSECENIAKKFKKRHDAPPGTIREVKSLHYSMVKKKSMQGLYSGISKTFGVGFKHTKANAQNLIFYLIKCSLVMLYHT